MSDAMEDRLLIRELVENWVVWRDAGDWDRFRTCWHDDGIMMATWFQGPADEFIRVTKEGWAKGVSILHFLGGTSIDVSADRAIAQTKMTISQRGEVEGVLCDVVCTGRFYDFVVRHSGDWKLLHRQPIYEKDRIDPLDPAARLKLDADALLDVGEVPVALRQLGQLGLIEREPCLRVDRIDAVLLVDRLAQRQPPAAGALLEEIVEAAGADDVAHHAVDRAAL